jgi:hypothetical protein
MTDDTKSAKAAPDQKQPLDTSARTGDRELSDTELDGVSGGTGSHEMANATYVNRVKTSDKQQKAVLDFVKG